VPRDLDADAHDVARALANTPANERSRHRRKKVEMLFELLPLGGLVRGTNIPGNVSLVSGNICQDCALSQYKLKTGLTQPVSSKEPHLTRLLPGKKSAWLITPAPHSGQNERRTGRPNPPMVVKLESLPSVAMAACSKTATIEKAEVVCRWQSLQWQRPTSSGSPVAVKRNCPHRQPPLRATGWFALDSIMFDSVATADYDLKF
jgi:hypothetical protein